VRHQYCSRGVKPNKVIAILSFVR